MILDLHNEYRANEPAANMQKMVRVHSLLFWHATSFYVVLLHVAYKILIFSLIISISQPQFSKPVEFF